MTYAALLGVVVAVVLLWYWHRAIRSRDFEDALGTLGRADAVREELVAVVRELTDEVSALAAHPLHRDSSDPFARRPSFDRMTDRPTGDRLRELYYLHDVPHRGIGPQRIYRRPIEGGAIPRYDAEIRRPRRQRRLHSP